jgi:uncharacterized protein
MADRAAGLIVVIDASTFVSAALKQTAARSEPCCAPSIHPTGFSSRRRSRTSTVRSSSRPKFDRFVSVERRQRILDIVVVAAERIEPTETVRECRDPKDDKYLALAAAGRADVIVSSDARHLLSMHPWRGIRILSPTNYLALR